MREITVLIRQLRQKGYTVRKGGRTSNHWKVYDKEGRLRSSFACSPSDKRALLNIRKYLRKAGIEL